MPDLPFAFARDHHVLIEAGNLVFSTEATLFGLLEARRRAAAPLTVLELAPDSFEARLTAHYRRAPGETAETELHFDTPPNLGTVITPRDLLEDASDAPVIELVNQLFRRALRSGASDLHVEPHEAGLRARLRIDGILRIVLDREDIPVRRIVARLKIMAGLDTAETRLPQDGRIGLRYGGRSIDVRVSTLPGHFGERLVMRLLDGRGGLLPLEALGLTAQQQAALGRLAAQPNGIVLTTGPTGSGKTTTLYTLLNLANRAERNIITVEDPVEYHIEGANQMPIHAEIGLTFAAGLRAALRQDPDVIMVGEIRDTETAKVAAQAALTGHLVFSSLHANDSVAAVTRLRDLGVEAPVLAATLRGVLAQRLLRTVCRDCGARTQTKQPCEPCHGSGYAGRTGVFELFEVQRDAASRIAQGVSEQALRTEFLPPDARLYARGLQLVESGATTVEEVTRVFGAE